MATVYECWQRNSSGSLVLIHEAETERKALEYLSENGGGIYKNVLHSFNMEVKPNDFPRSI
jgi:hypothetical protein